MISIPFLLSGQAELPKKLYALRAGPLTACFDPDTGWLRQVRVGDHEILRAVYGAVRDAEWNAVPVRIKDLKVASTESSFQISFEAECLGGEVNFAWWSEIIGSSDGRVEYRFEGEARSSFQRNRIGLCALHPILECAGKPCTVEQTDGTQLTSAFPKTIAPAQIFKNVRALSYEPAPGFRVEVRCEGDVFETEDQRNWADASFKTYGTPVDLPVPVQVAAGTRISQRISLAPVGSPRKILPILQGRPPQLAIATTPVLAKPAIGLRLAPDAGPLTARQIGRLRALGLAHLRCDLDLSREDFPDILAEAARQAHELNTSLHVALFFTAAGEMEKFAGEFARLKPPASLFLVFNESELNTHESWVKLAREKLLAAAPQALFATGSPLSFYELNNRRPASSATAFPCFPINPQVHAPDFVTMVENLGGLGSMIETAKEFSPRPAVISPITLRPAFEYLAAPAAGRSVIRETRACDPRQASLFGAGWTMACIARLAEAGHAHSLTLFETTGPLGVMTDHDGAGKESLSIEPGGGSRFIMSWLTWRT